MDVRSRILRPAVLVTVTVALTAGAFAHVAFGRTGTRAARPVAAGRAAAPLPPGQLLVPAGDVTDLKESIRAGAPEARALVYLAEGEVFVRDLETGATTRVTHDGPEGWEWNPRFRDAASVSWIGNEGIMIADIETARARVFAAAESVTAYAWSPSGSEVAYLTSTWSDRDQVLRTSVVVVSDAGAREERDLGLILPEGYCGRDPDGDVALSYSPDGRRIVIEHAMAGSGPTAVVLLREDLKQESLNHWAWARFLPDSSIIAREAGVWVRLSSDGTERLPIPADARHVAVSPDGARVAFEIPGERPVLRAVRLSDGGATLIAKNYVNPMWISPDSLVAFATETCSECGGSWSSAGYARRFDGSERGERLPFDSPGQIDALYD